ncbi:UNVERIFIED_CONTAM: Spastin [Sesamum latifolium]|uniref:Spastin n=1 Tax=Sesamum latifolium TaxID=2727402 RepID=A0AAW2UIR4_9LAMI
MYARRIKYKNQRWNDVVRQGKYSCSSNCRDYSVGQRLSPAPRASSLIERYLSNTSVLLGLAPERRSTRLYWRSDISWRNCLLRFYSSEGDGRNASEDKRAPTKDVADCDKEKIHKESTTDSARHSDAHARLGEQDQMEWLKNEKLAIENKKKESPFLSRRERFRNEFLRRVVPWEKITVSWDTFPYYLHDHTKKLLVECAASHLKHKKFTTDYGGRLTSSSGRILLQSIPGTELYRERLVRALARDLQVPLMVLDGNILAPYDFNEDESESDEENAETSESEVEDENDASNEEDYTSGGEARTDGSDDEVDIHASAEALRKLIPYNIEEFEKSVSGESETSSTSSTSESAEPSDKANRPLKKGDRVKYIGPSVCMEANNRIVLGKIPTPDGPTNAYTVIRGRTLSSGQRGEVYEVNGEQVAVIFDIGGKTTEEVKDEKTAENAAKPSVCWLHVKDIEHDLDAQTHDCYVAMEVLCEVLKSQQPLIVYFPDSSLWSSRAVSKSNRKEFVRKVQEMFDQLSGPVVLICGQNKVETGSKEKEKFTMILPNLGRLAKLPLPLKRLTEGLRASKRSGEDEIYKLFTNVMSIYPPKEEDLLRIFNKQIEEDRRIVISRSNLTEIHKVLEEHDLSCMDLLHVNTDGVILTKEKAEKVIGWAKSHHLSSCLLPSVKGDRLQLPRESLELAILRLKEQEAASKKPSQNLKNLAKDEYESNFVSAVVPPGEIGVKFDDVGALEDVKKALNELVILPMRRPELFSRGNLLRPCKGILLFGPPGTGKTLLAKALATEAGASFISITGSTLTSKWFGDAEKLTRALFSFASKLAPVIIFVDEVDSLLGARGGAFEHEATRRMRNEFMAAWDGLRSKDSQRILILGATNRPFDLDDAVIRRLPRRIYVDLPDAENRLKILKIILARENLESGFPFEQLANATEGYSGSDLKNLCIAAAYRPVQELLEKESKGDKHDGLPVLRPLKLEDFTHSKAKVGPSVAYDAASMNELRKWNDQYGEGGSRRKSPFGF